MSRLSGYRLVDWLALFGIFLDDVSHYQVAFPSVRTVEVDATIHEPDISVPWLYDLKEADLRTPLTPLSQWVAIGSSRRLDTYLRNGTRKFRYLKIGSHDALAFPDLLPGSIVRVRDNSSVLERVPVGRSLGRTFFLVRHSRGFTCSRLVRSESDKIVLCSRHLPYAPIELSFGAEGVVLGTADVEFRSLARVPKPVVSARLERYHAPLPLDRASPAQSVGHFIRRARETCGISFREASARTRIIARELGDGRYYCSPGALSDYETRKFAPRHIHKLISICSVYFARATDLFKACGAALDGAGSRAMPPEFLGVPTQRRDGAGESFRFLRKMTKRFGPLPWFLRSAGSALFGLANLSPRDVFWVGSSHESKHACLTGVQLLVVDRRQKRPRASLSCPVWAQPIYVLQKRGGSYLWGSCRLENGILALYTPLERTKPTRLRKGVDAEVVGRVVGIVRRLT